MHIDWWTLGLQTVNVLVLLFLLKRFLLKPVLGMIAARQDAVAAETNAAKAARAEAEAARAEAETQLASVAAEKAEQLAAAAKEADTARNAALQSARDAAESVRKAAESDIEKERRAAKLTLETHAGELAMTIAERLVGRLPASSRVEGFTEPFLAGIAALPPESRALIANAGTVDLLVAEPMPEDWASSLRRKIETATGGPLAAFEIRTEPALIAGIELVTPHLTVRNSFRADLETIRAELVNHGG